MQGGQEHWQYTSHFLMISCKMRKSSFEIQMVIGYWKYAPCRFLCKNTVILNALIKMNSPTSNTLLI